MEERRRWADRAFEDFWAAYPRKVGKVAAKKVWDRLRPTPELLEKMSAALDWQREQEQWQDPQYIPHPRTWLSQGRWDDEEPVAVQKRMVVPKNLAGIQEWLLKKTAER